MKKHEIYAWYFPNWHVDARNEGWHGKGWTEWECVKHATPRFEGHVQPKVPLWGYADEADPAVMEQKITTAKAHGIDGFLWDFYWFEDGGYRLRALEEGFFGAPSHKDFKIALMWCNHDPIYAHPASPRHRHDPLMSGDVTPEGFRRMTDYMIKNYFHRDCFIRVEGKLLFIIWDLPKLIRNFGGEEGARFMLDDLRERVRAAGLGEMHLATILRMMPGYYEEGGIERIEASLRNVGIDGAMQYNVPLSYESFPEMPYEVHERLGLAMLKRDMANLHLSYELTVSGGWDCSPRTLQSDKYENYGYPWCHIVTERSPEAYRRTLRAVKALADSPDFNGHFIIIATWNEWTEGNYIEPDEEFGYAFLEAIRDELAT